VLRDAQDKARDDVGSPYYLSPEIIDGKSYGFETDVWSLGILLYEMTALKYPFSYKDPKELYHAISTKNIDINCLSFNYSHDLKDLIKKVLTKNPMLRPNLK